MIPVRVMQPAVVQKILMIAVRHDRILRMAMETHHSLAFCGVFVGHLESMVNGPALADVMKMSVLQVVDVIAVTHSNMPATFAVHVNRSRRGCHDWSPRLQ
jgi:hypothetical protein